MAAQDLLPGWAERRLKPQSAAIFGRSGGSAPPLLLHGPPHAHACWHTIAAELARHCTLVIADLGGYRANSLPPDRSEHRRYTKRTMAQDGLTRSLGHARGLVGGHDGASGHFLAEQTPNATLATLPPFLAAQGAVAGGRGSGHD
jgi:haloacetate dehalogenase